MTRSSSTNRDRRSGRRSNAALVPSATSSATARHAARGVHHAVPAESGGVQEPWHVVVEPDDRVVIGVSG